MLLDDQHDIEIAGRPAEDTGLAFTLVADAGAVFNTGRYVHLHLVLANQTSFTAAGLAGIRDHLTGAAAGAAGACHAEEPLLEAKLTAASAGAAGSGLLAISHAAAMARIASLGLAD